MAGNFIFFCPELLPWLFDKVKFKDLKLAFIRQSPNRSTTELPLLIVPMSSPTIANTNVSGSCFCLSEALLFHVISHFLSVHSKALLHHH
jgi:hypothetical protein